MTSTVTRYVLELTLQDLLAADDAERGRIVLPLEHASKVPVKRIPISVVRSSARIETGQPV